jgi:Flp pilus assembly protein TadG
VSPISRRACDEPQLVKVIESNLETLLMLTTIRRHTGRHSHSQRRRGAAAVEFAMILPVFFTVIMGMIEVGRGIMVSQILENAARNAARMAILDNTANATVISTTQSFVASAAGVGNTDTTVHISVNGSSGAALSSANPGDTILVTVSLPASKISWVPANYLSGMNLSTICVMYHE